MGPKPYMEDEHVCIDNLIEYLGASVKFSSPGAFYGVCLPLCGIRFFFVSNINSSLINLMCCLC